ncbi:MAG TPA: hypothetical protein VL132_10110 [Planctomycetaceae bacterium]|nr:hypothetical protein [Planctomycetaceae bacterium]
MQRVFRLLAIVFGLAAFVVPAAVWWVGWTVILAAAGSEYHAIDQHDRPASYHLLTFGPWKNGVGPCTSSHIVSLPRDAVILEHRIGKAGGFATKFTYYEAKYQMPDKSLRVTHAAGPIPLISHERETLAACFFGCSAIAFACLLASRWTQSRSRTLLPDESRAVLPSDSIID